MSIGSGRFAKYSVRYCSYIVELNDTIQSVKNEQQSLEHELDFVVAQQRELQEMLAPLERTLLADNDRLRDPEREHMYTLAENLDTQLRQMSEDLKEVIEHLNETNRSQDTNDPVSISFTSYF
ncbi:Nuclear pore glycoprotein p62 [Papilio machaon]|uniref:Nuclear pore glycoprotein p62 n=1 Tax=Papilio machaon TaxID=76193 RepID=A0A0N1II04_PAPMA|nr:Nuclear pore glycoprotein p62 [Papilio machaon]